MERIFSIFDLTSSLIGLGCARCSLSIGYPALSAESCANDVAAVQSLRSRQTSTSTRLADTTAMGNVRRWAAPLESGGVEVKRVLEGH